MKKIDFKKELKHLYKPSAKIHEIVHAGPMNFIMIDGEGDPNTSQEFADAVEALFAVSYNLKFMIKRGSQQVDYGVMPLEGLWYADDMTAFESGSKEDWKWMLMIMQPKYVTKELYDEAVENVKTKKNPAALHKLRFENYTEGEAAQIMHIGPFSEEGPTVAGLHDFIEDQGYKRTGLHHEIYLSDIRRAAPEKWKTVIRQPVSN